MDNGGISMYVDTLITLQENLTTYAVDGKKVSGHVTINSPGMIKCYVQNLKGFESGHEYMCYVFSKAHNKGVRIGALSTQKESRWRVNEKDVAGSGLSLSDLDAVAIVAENGMRGTDTVLMGFKNNRYMIIPLIDDMVKGGQKAKPQEKKQVECKESKLVNHKNIVQPDAVVEGENPVSKINDGKKNGGLKLQENQQNANTSGTVSSVVTTPSNIWTPIYHSNQTTMQSASEENTLPLQNGNMDNGNMTSQYEQQPTDQGAIMSVQNGNANYNMSNQNQEQQPIDQGTIMSVQNGNANYNNMANQSQGQQPTDQGEIMSLQNENANNPNMLNQNQQQQPIDQGAIMSLQNGNANNNMLNQNQEEQPIDQGIIMSLQNGNTNDNMTNQSQQQQSINQGNPSNMNYKTSKTPILGEYEFDEIVATEKLEDNTSILTKQAENLPEVEKAPAVSMSVKSGEPYATSTSHNASVVRDEKNMDEMERVAEQLAKELENIIAHLKSEGIATEKLLEVEKQIEAIGNTARSYNMEQTLENRYTSQQSRESDENIEDNLVNHEEKVIGDTSPKNAITYIKSCMSTGGTKQVFGKAPIADNECDISEEIDYLGEMERKIQERD